MMKMSRLQPQLKQLELACGDDKQKYQQEVMALYKSEGVSMYGRLPVVVPAAAVPSAAVHCHP